MKKIFTVLLLSISLNSNSQVCFDPAVNYTATGVNPINVCTADFNSDGKLDLAMPNDNSANVSVFLGTGTGSFGVASYFPVGNAPRSLITADFDGDGKADLATANGLGGNVSILLGTGTGSFTPVTNFAANSFPASVTSADFNNDGKLDLAVSNSSSNDISILLGTGTGSFGAAVNFLTGGNNPKTLVNADFNGDSKIDLAVVNLGTSNLSILLGTGTGSFTAPTTFTLNANPVGLLNKDLNADGKIDLISAHNTNSIVSVLMGTGTGSFAIPATFTVPGSNMALISDDYNMDGYADLAVANSSVSILIGNGGGGFGPATTYSTGSGANGLCSADFNSDSKPDIATANYYANNMSILLNKALIFMVNSPSGLCSGGSATLTALGAHNYTWNPGALNGGSVVVSPTIATSYTVLGTSSITGCSNTKTLTLNVIPSPTVVANTSSSLICSGEAATLTATGALFYTWNPGTLIGGVVVVSPTATTIYTVVGSASNGCTDKKMISQNVSPCTGISITDPTENRFVVYPNPGYGEVKIVYSSDAMVTVINELGQKVRTISLNSNNNYSEVVKDLPAGIYFINMNNSFVKKLIILKWIEN